LAGGGHMAELIRSKNWNDSPLGDLSQWPQSLRTALSIVLANRFPMAIVWGPSMIHLYNDAYRSILDAANLPVLVGNSIYNSFPALWERYEHVYRQVLDGQVIVLDNQQVVSDRYFDISYSPIRDENGGVGGVLAAFYETTGKLFVERSSELSRKNEELRRSEERYQRMTNEVEDYAIILLSKEGIIENWNRGAEKIKGWVAEEIVGKHFRIFYTPEDQANKVPESLVEEAIKNGKSSFEGWRLRKDGSRFWAYAVITALHDDKNDVIGFSKVTRDLTERKLAEDKMKMYAEQLEMKNKELERSNSELSSFSYVASHDLQEPLRKIQSFGNLIQAKDADTLSDVSRDYFDRMVKAAVRMQHLIDSLLEFSRTATGNKTFEEADLNHLLEEVKKELADRIEEKKGRIVADKLPVCKVIVFQFRQLLFNLINNSLKYAREDESPIIKVTCEYLKAREVKDPDALPGRDYYRFSISDNGIGFEQEYAEKIFELFQRLHGRSEYSGSGIGLAICKKIMENHHGFIRAYSELGKGATFRFYLPVTK
jgi:PAS domain S-box